MNRADMVKQLSDLGFDVSKINDSTPDEVLAETLKALQTKQQAAESVVPNAEGDDGEKLTKEQKLELLAALAEDDEVQAAIAEMDKDGNPEENEKLAEKFAADLDEARASLDGDKPDIEKIKAVLDQTKAAMAEGSEEETKEKEEEEAKMMAEQFAELAKNITASVTKTVNDKLAELDSKSKEIDSKAKEATDTVAKFSEDKIRDEKVKRVEQFCESMQSQGKIAPHEMDESDPAKKHLTIKARLLNADDRKVVHKFTENGKEVAVTQLDAEMDAIRSRPALHGETVKVDRTKQAAGEEAEIRANFAQFSEGYKHHDPNASADKMVAAFKEIKKKRPDYTVAEFLSA